MRRGQGIVEASLLMLVLVTIVVLGIHLAEVMQVSLKGPMISHSVLFDAQAHDVRRGVVATQLAVDTTFRREAADLDLRSSANAATFRGVFTTVPFVTGLSSWAMARVDRPTLCSYPPNDPYARIPASLDSGFSIESSARLNITSLRVPRSFADGRKGFFGEGLIMRESYALCALGKPLGAGCSGKLKLILDDHAAHDEGRAGPWDRLDCGLMGCANTDDKTRSEDHFSPGKGQASALATAIFGTSPANEDKFWMSFRDANSGFEENGFKTGPGPANRTNCYLGAACP